MLQSTQAIILNTYKYGDTSTICNLLSCDYGKISFIAKGATTLKKTNKAILQPLHNIEIDYYYKSKRNLQILKEVSIVDHFKNIKLNFKKLTYSFICLELVDKISQKNNPCKIIFRLLLSTIKKIEHSKNRNIQLYYIFFQFQLLKYIGFLPIFEYCFICSSELKQSYYNYNLGHLVCTQCNNSNSSHLEINNITQSMLFSLSNTHIDKLIETIDSNSSSIDCIYKYLTAYISFHVYDINKINSLQLINNVH